MKSVAKARGTKAVYFDDSGKILEIAANDSKEGQHAWFRIDDLMPLLTGELNSNDYAVSKDGISFSIKKIDLVKPADYQIDTRITQIQNEENPDIVLVLTNKSLTVKISDIIITDDYNLSDDVKIDGFTSHMFYLTLKDNPNYIFDTIEIPFKQLFSERIITVAHKHEEIPSIYSQKHFDRYSLEII